MKPYWTSSDGDIYHGNVLDVLKQLSDGSVQMCVTSPPYWGLRDYGNEPQIWDGEPDCGHVWGHKLPSNPAKLREKRVFGDWKTGGSPEIKFSNAETQGQFCQLCGAWKGSLGLESTPELYISHMVQIFREVKRVLRKDGTLWLNIGDSYCGGGRAGKNGQAYGGMEAQNRCNKQVKWGPPTGKIDGLKPKDLVGIPWALAKALRDPYYTGRIKAIEDRIWLAAMIDGEGCMFIHKRKAGTPSYSKYCKKDGVEVVYERKNDTYGAGLEVANTHMSIIHRCKDITGMGSICTVERETKYKKRNIPLHRWNMRSNQCREIIKEIYPYLVGKQHEARLILGCPSSGPEAEKAHASLIALHNGKDACIDFKPPKSLYEPGWYLRSDIIWSKNNPMPESCTDRPTKAHEYLFLLTKSANYYYDADAIKEEMSPNTHSRGKAGKPAMTMNKLAASGSGIKNNDSFQAAMCDMPPGSKRNKRSVWTIPTEPTPDAHFATFPQKLIEPCILAGTSEKGCCVECGAPWERIVDNGKLVGRTKNDGNGYKLPKAVLSKGTKIKGRSEGWTPNHYKKSKTIGWQPTCRCLSDDTYGITYQNPGGEGRMTFDTEPCTVMDPFLGSGKTAMVAMKHGRKFLGIELSLEYLDEIAIPKITKERKQRKMF